MGRGDGGNDVEASEGTGGGDGGAPQASQIVAIGMRDLFDQSEHVKALELSRHRRWGDVQVRQQIGATPAVDVELTQLQGTQQGLLGSVEEIGSSRNSVGEFA